MELESNQLQAGLPATGDASTLALDQTSTIPNDQVQDLEQNDAKIVDEFQYLLEKSQQLFAGLRDLPPIGAFKQWQPYFQKTFEVYTKRHVLENKDLYGLKRWEIGEIASKIGQLYYHYYLRTSETNYLYESFIFYEAIRERAYFKEVGDLKNTALIIKKLRYYARYIVVCLLLNDLKLVKKLNEELSFHVVEYKKAHKAADSTEWQLILEEIDRFVDIQCKFYPRNFDGQMLEMSARLPLDETKIDASGSAPKLRIQEVILVGNVSNQIKFSELTLDTFHFLQLLEREPQLDPKKQHESGEEKKAPTKRQNPHKYLLFKPTISQLIYYMSAAFKELGEDSGLLLYVSADGFKVESSSEPKSSILDFFSGGVSTASQKKTSTDDLNMPLTDCLHPGDLIMFTRRPLMLVIESSNSLAFKNFPQVFNQPLICLLSPQKLPEIVPDQTQSGNIFSLFLHNPLLCLCLLKKSAEIGHEAWDKSQTLIKNIEMHVHDLFFTTTGVDKSYKRFIQDDFAKRILVRFALFHYLGNEIPEFKDSAFLPLAYPALPVSLFTDQKVSEELHQLFTLIA